MALTPIQLIGFAPDRDPSIAGVITDCTMMVPTIRGMKGAPGVLSTSLPALAADARGAAFVTKLDGSTRFFVGTQTELYESAGASWTTVSAATYTGSAESKWGFSQFGDTTYATNKTDAMQSSTTGNFASVTGPKASLIESVSGFLMAADTNDGSFGNQSDRWWCCARYDGSDWVPSVATECATGRLIDVPGPLRACKRLGSDVVMYKERGMWLGRYVGAPDIWDFTLVPGSIGSSSQESIVDIGTQHIFIGYEDIYLFDGTRPVPIGQDIKEWFFSRLSSKYRYKIRGAHDRKNSLVYFYYPSTSSLAGALDSCIVYHYPSGKWGRADRNIEVPVEFLTGAITYATIGDHFTTYADIPAIGYDSEFWNETSPVPTIINTSHTVQTLLGSSVSSDFTTGDLGDDFQVTMLRQARLRFSDQPTTAGMTNYYTMESGGNLTTDATTTMENGHFDAFRSALWHRLKFAFTGDIEVTALTLDAIPDGES